MAERQPFYVGVKGIIIDDAEDSAFIVRDRKGRWELPGGRIDSGYGIEGTFAKELDEEIPGAEFIGLDEVVHISIGEKTAENGHKLFLVFSLARVVMPESVVLSDEHTECAWVDEITLAEYDMYQADHDAIVIAFDQIQQRTAS